MARSADPGIALRDALRELHPVYPPRPDPPRTIDEAAVWFPTTRRGSANPAIAQLLGVSPRSVERYRRFERGAGGEARRPSAAAVARVTKLARRRQLAAWRAAKKALDAAFDRVEHVRRHGLDVRIEAEVRISKIWEWRVMPVDVAGRRRYVFLDGARLDRVLDAYEADELDEAGDELLEVFAEVHGIPVAEWGEVREAEVIAQ